MGLKVIGIGDNVCDKYYPAMMMYPGGQAMNFSVYAKMLGADSAYMGVFGRDEVAEHVIKTLDELGVDHSCCRQYDGENGYAKVRLVDGDREFIMSNRGGVVNEHPLELTQEDLDYIKGFRLVHTSNNGHFDSQLKMVKAAGVPVSYDFSGHWKEEYYLEEIAPLVDFAFLSCGQAQEEEIKEACRRICEKGRETGGAGCRIVVATRGSLGSLIYDGRDFYEQKPKLVAAVDTLGAGDSFATAFLLSLLKDGYLENKTPESGNRGARDLEPGIPDTGNVKLGFLRDAMEAGAEFAAKTCMVNGAFGHGVTFHDESV